MCSNCHKELHYDKDRFDNNIDEIKEKMNTMLEKNEKIDRELVSHMYESGMKQSDIANKFGASKSTISMIIKAFKI